ncbi:hypothetical protein BT63DRAFT_453835 [Microthyrium microscopicum]|uniref:Heterokaryon incompatibility domain-containing protein n=1 Tax=Microthyrium microscopicum TaxID=703497 RepID=A0A6A6UI20_9PEZI|nr:hypothetical protein BT63DRAFT_453835 [Microthyrium microscopicum]
MLKTLAAEVLEIVQQFGNKSDDSFARIPGLLSLLPAEYAGYSYSKKWMNAVSGHQTNLAGHHPLGILEWASKFIFILSEDCYHLLNDAGKERFQDLSRSFLRPLEEAIAAQTPYVHQPIDSANDEIRVLVLLSKPGERLRCQLQHVLTSTAEYIALSYEWGDPQLLFSITVVNENGQEVGNIPLTNNLHSALSDLRDSDAIPSNTFWIDQISIEQSNTTERQEQVSRMRNIYTSANSVISYLGPSEANDEQGFRLLQGIYDQFQDVIRDLGIDYSRVRRQFQDPSTVPESLRFDERQLTKVSLRTMSHFTTGPSTRRVWMAQETCLNSNVRMLRGTLSCPWIVAATPHLLVHISALQYEHWLDNGRTWASFSTTGMFRSIRESQNHSLRGVFGLLGFLVTAGSCLECSDPRDMIFGLLALTDVAEPLHMKADYSKSYAEVLRGFTVSLLHVEGAIRLLGSWVSDRHDKHLTLPSWVYRFPNAPDIPSHLAPHLFHASKGWYVPAQFSLDQSILHLQGIRISSVTEIMPVDVMPSSGSVKLTRVLLEQLEQALKHAQQLLRVDDEKSDSIIAHTLIGGDCQCDPHHRNYQIPINVRPAAMDITPPFPNNGSQTPDPVFDGFNLNEDNSSARNLDKAHDESMATALRTLIRIVTNAKDYLLRNPEILLVPLSPWLTELEQTRTAVESLLSNNNLYQRTLCLTDDHRISLAFNQARPGDVIVLLSGAPHLYVLRPAGNDKYTYIGDAYMYGIMHGEILQKPNWRDSVETFSLI